MEQRLSFVSLGVDDLARSRSFYEALGWEVADDPEEVLYLQLGGMVLVLVAHEALAHETGADERIGWGGIALGHCVRSPGEVDAVLREARTAGGTIARRAEETPWGGGYSGVFLDPDSHAWEVSYNPGWSLDETGAVTV